MKVPTELLPCPFCGGPPANAVPVFDGIAELHDALNARSLLVIDQVADSSYVTALSLEQGEKP